jgi:hypothetical protein
VDGSRRSPGFASQDLSFRPASGCCNRPSQVVFSDIPVTGCVVLAYSCAAARDLHPLPIRRRLAALRSCANLNIEKEQDSSPANVPATALPSQPGWPAGNGAFVKNTYVSAKQFAENLGFKPWFRTFVSYQGIASAIPQVRRSQGPFRGRVLNLSFQQSVKPDCFFTECVPEGKP